MQIDHLWHHYMVWHHGIVKKIAVFSLLFLTFLGGFFASRNIAEKEINVLTAENQQCIAQIQNASKQGSITQQDMNLYLQKTKALEHVVESKMYFSTSTSRLPNAVIEVSITLKGGSTMKTDASDLVLKLSDNLRIVEIRPGQSYPSYPRKLIGKEELTITGIATLNGSDILFGEPNKTFATLVIEKTGPAGQKGTLSLDKTNTQVYLQGKSVFDLAKTFDKIEL